MPSNLYHLKPHEDLPEGIVDEFKQLISFVTSVKATGEEGTIAATLNSLSEEELSDLAIRIVSMLDSDYSPYG